MNKELSELALYLTKLYGDVPITDETVKEIEAKFYTLPVDRFEVIVDIDTALAEPANEKSKQKVCGIEIIPEDENLFKIRFIASTVQLKATDFGINKNADGVQQISEEGAKKLLEALGLGDIDGVTGMDVQTFNMDEGGGPAGGVDGTEQIEDTQEAYLRLSQLREVVNLIKAVEDNHCGNFSVLYKYLPAIEQRYLHPLLPNYNPQQENK